MKFIKKIIREELEKVLALLGETDFYKNVLTAPNPKDELIYDYQKGREFAGNSIEVDIDNMNRYNLIEYLPKNSDEEMWTFEFDTVNGTTLIVDIKKNVGSGKSLWSMIFGQLYKGEQTPSIIGKIENIEGYDNFVNVVNSRLAPKIDPAKY
jgi:hypothetical protein